MENIETPTPGETQVPTASESVAKPAASENVDTAQKTREEIAALQAAKQQLEKEKQKLEMERNLQRNRAEEEERKRLEEQAEYKTLYEREQQKLRDREQREEVRRLEKFRTDIINSYPDESTRKAAQALLDKNPNAIVWTEGATEYEAKQELEEQLNALKAVVAPETTQPKVDPSNPHPGKAASATTKTFGDLSLSEMEAELEKKLPGAGL